VTERAPTIRGMDSPEHLRAWFQAMGHPYLVFKIADVLDLDDDDQRLYLDLLDRFGKAPPLHLATTTRRRVQRTGTNGYSLIPLEDLCAEATIKDLQVVQALVENYRGVRQGKFEPSIVDDCTNCKGNGAKCPHCDGTGKVRVLLEMSPLEIELARGTPWEDIENG